MTSSLPISDKHELLALYSALFAAKFHLDPSPPLGGSTFVANLITRVAAMLDAEGLGTSGTPPASARAREWEVALTAACQATLWPEWDRAEKESYARNLLAPLPADASDIEQFVAAVDAQWERPDEAPPSDAMVGDLLVFREYDLKVPGEPDDGVQVRVGVPHPVPSKVNFYCRFQVTGLSGPSKVRAAYGIDALQALELAIRMAMAVVRTSEEARAGRLHYPGDPAPALDLQSLRLIGYWVSDDDPDWPNPRAFVDDDWDQRERGIVKSYLSHGHVMWATAGLSTCRLCGQPNGCAELSDGVYLWPEGLAHYLEKHSVRLPQEFVDHVHATLDGREALAIDRTWWQRQSKAAKE
jgi:hypothetical protein